MAGAGGSTTDLRGAVLAQAYAAELDEAFPVAGIIGPPGSMRVVGLNAGWPLMVVDPEPEDEHTEHEAEAPGGDAATAPAAPLTGVVWRGAARTVQLPVHAGVAGVTGANCPRVKGVELSVLPAALSAVSVPSVCPSDSLAETGAASATQPLTGTISSVAPPAKAMRTSVTVDPVAAVTTATGSPSAVPNRSVWAALTGLAASGWAPNESEVPTIWAVDTSASNWGRPGNPHEAARPAGSGKLVRNPRIVTVPAVRLKRWVYGRLATPDSPVETDPDEKFCPNPPAAAAPLAAGTSELLDEAVGAEAEAVWVDAAE